MAAQYDPWSYLTTFCSILIAMLVILTVQQVGVYAYNVLLHPLRRFPGPVLCAASAVPFIWQSIQGEAPFWITELHEKYGAVVRIAPNQLSFNGAGAFKGIYGWPKDNNPLEKDPGFYRGPEVQYNIMNSDTMNHTRQRRVLGHAFTDRALKLQESMFQSHVDQMVSRIRDSITIQSHFTCDLVEAFRLTTFYIMADLVFGDPRDRSPDTFFRPWLEAMNAANKFGAYINCICHYKWLEFLLLGCRPPKSMVRLVNQHMEFAIDRIDRRIESQDNRPDVWGMIREVEGKHAGLSREEMYHNSLVLMAGGTETTVNLLCGITYHLLLHPGKMQRLSGEIRDAFQDEEEITMERLRLLPYLNACINEGLRIFPPAPGALPRVTPNGPPKSIDGMNIPAGTKVGVTILAAMRNPDIWRNPREFVPERWLSDDPQSALYQNDNRNGFQPFSMGRRDCIGRIMAYHETRLILTKLLYHFDISLCEESKHWTEQKIYATWEKKSLLCQLRLVERQK